MKARDLMQMSFVFNLLHPTLQTNCLEKRQERKFLTVRDLCQLD